jgi:pyruvate dehydrogenase E1 component alpha subunit
MRYVAQQAIDKARSGGGPTLIEAISYRLGDHTTADDASRYRDAAAVERQWAFEPVARLRKYLARIEAWDKEKEEQLLKEANQALNQAVEQYLATPPPQTAAMFDHLYARLPAALHEQRDVALRFAPAAAKDNRDE